MLHGLALFFIVSAAVMSIHKLGHYLVGRWVVGVPAADIRLVLTRVPQYVALWDGEQWTTPTAFEDYLAAYSQYDPKSTHLAGFLAAGELTQTVGVIGLVVVGILVDVTIVAQSAILASLLLTGYHLFSDLGLMLHTGQPSGDFTGLWTRSPRSAVAVGLLFGVPHGVLYSVFI